MQVKKLTPLLAVASVERARPLWESLGFEQTVSVPHEEALGFALLQRDEIEVMLQSHASLAADVDVAGTEVLPETARSALYVEVDDLDAAVAALPEVAILVRERETFYGARETILRDADGHVITLAEFSSGEE